MALQDIITNLGTAIINLVNVRISKAFTTHDSELEEILLDLKAKIDELAGSNTPDVPVTPTTEEFDINGYTGTITTLLEDENYVTIYEFNSILQIHGTLSGTYDKKPARVVFINGSDEEIEVKYNVLENNMIFTDTEFKIVAFSVKKIKFYNNTNEKINIMTLTRIEGGGSSN